MRAAEIRDRLLGQSPETVDPKDIDHYQGSVSSLNERLALARRLSKSGFLEEALRRLEEPTPLADEVEDLRDQRLVRWLAAYGDVTARPPMAVDEDSVREVEDIRRRVERMAPLLRRHHRQSLARAQIDDRFETLCALARTDPENPAWHQELKVLEPELLARALRKAKELLNSRPIRGLEQALSAGGELPPTAYGEEIEELRSLGERFQAFWHVELPVAQVRRVRRLVDGIAEWTFNAERYAELCQSLDASARSVAPLSELEHDFEELCKIAQSLRREVPPPVIQRLELARRRHSLLRTLRLTGIALGSALVTLACWILYTHWSEEQAAEDAIEALTNLYEQRAYVKGLELIDTYPAHILAQPEIPALRGQLELGKRVASVEQALGESLDEIVEEVGALRLEEAARLSRAARELFPEELRDCEPYRTSVRRQKASASLDQLGSLQQAVEKVLGHRLVQAQARERFERPQFSEIVWQAGRPELPGEPSDLSKQRESLQRSLAETKALRRLLDPVRERLEAVGREEYRQSLRSAFGEFTAGKRTLSARVVDLEQRIANIGKEEEAAKRLRDFNAGLLQRCEDAVEAGAFLSSSMERGEWPQMNPEREHSRSAWVQCEAISAWGARTTSGKDFDWSAESRTVERSHVRDLLEEYETQLAEHDPFFRRRLEEWRAAIEAEIPRRTDRLFTEVFEEAIRWGIFRSMDEGEKRHYFLEKPERKGAKPHMYTVFAIDSMKRATGEEDTFGNAGKQYSEALVRFNEKPLEELWNAVVEAVEHCEEGGETWDHFILRELVALKAAPGPLQLRSYLALRLLQEWQKDRRRDKGGDGRMDAAPYRGREGPKLVADCLASLVKLEPNSFWHWLDPEDAKGSAAEHQAALDLVEEERVAELLEEMGLRRREIRRSVAPRELVGCAVLPSIDSKVEARLSDLRLRGEKSSLSEGVFEMIKFEGNTLTFSEIGSSYADGSYEIDPAVSLEFGAPVLWRCSEREGSTGGDD